MMNLLFSIVFSLTCLITSFAWADQWIMSVQKEDLSPFKHRHGFAPGGINVDIMQSIADEMNVSLEFRDFSIAEGRSKFLSGEVTIDCCLNEIWFPNDQASHLFSDPIYSMKEIFIFPRGKRFPVPDTIALKQKKVIGIAGFTYPGQENYGARLDGRNPLEVLKMLDAGKGDVAVLERHAASFYMNHYDFDLEFGDPYYSAEVGVRLHPSLKHQMNDINKAIAKFKNNGRIHEIIEKNIR